MIIKTESSLQMKSFGFSGGLLFLTWILFHFHSIQMALHNRFWREGFERHK